MKKIAKISLEIINNISGWLFILAGIATIILVLTTIITGIDLIAFSGGEAFENYNGQDHYWDTQTTFGISVILLILGIILLKTLSSVYCKTDKLLNKFSLKKSIPDIEST